jgi:hypothetical protein
LPHAIDDLVDSFAVEESGIVPHDCDTDPNDADCPPGCPNCHACTPTCCRRRRFAWLGGISGSDLADLIYDSTAPPQPLLASVFRPPRALV